jgi:hypothetical protein
VPELPGAGLSQLAVDGVEHPGQLQRIFISEAPNLLAVSSDPEERPEPPKQRSLSRDKYDSPHDHESGVMRRESVQCEDQANKPY